MDKFAGNLNSERVIAPHKARILVAIGAAILLHAFLLLFFWPHRWPTSYKWLLLPDAIGAYFVVGLGFQHLNRKTNKEQHKQEMLTDTTCT